MKTGIKPLEKKIKRLKKQMFFMCKCEELTTEEKVNLTTIYVKLLAIYNNKLRQAIHIIDVVI